MQQTYLNVKKKSIHFQNKKTQNLEALGGTHKKMPYC